MNRIRTSAVTVLFFAGLAACAAGAEQAGPSGAVILDSHQGYWRTMTGWKTPEQISEAGTVSPILERYDRYRHKRPGDRKPLRLTVGPVPAADWMKPDFDDSQWGRSRGPVGNAIGYDLFGSGGSLYAPNSVAKTLFICMRGRYRVTDPSRAKGLTLSLDYRGGAVVYVNGREVKRQHLPAGPLTIETPAEAYPKEAYLWPDDIDTPTAGRRRARWPKGPKLLDEMRSANHPQAVKDRYALRARRLEVLIPSDVLVTGVNVLAVAIHRAPLNDVYVTTPMGGFRNSNSAWPNPWPHCRLERLHLTAPPGAAAEPNTGATTGFVAWTEPATAKKMTVAASPDPLEAVRPMRIVGARNGAFCGQALVSSDAAMPGFRAVVTDLAGTSGTIPASAVEILYARPDGPPKSRQATFDSLHLEPPGTVAVNPGTKRAVQAVWLKVRVPRDAEPGDYAGTLSISFTGGTPIEMPVNLRVSAFTLPDPQKSRTFVDLVQSPETVAIKYDVPIWSDAHFKYLEPSLRLLGEAGNKTTYIRLITRTHFGDTVAMVRFIRGKTGTWSRDYSVLERYLDLVEKYQGKPLVTVLYCNERYTVYGKRAYVTEYDPATKQMKEIEAPGFSGEAGKAFWGPVFKEVRELAAKRGIEGTLMIGCGGDFTGPKKQFVGFMAEVAPGLPWVMQGHANPSKVYGVPVGYQTAVWTPRGPKDPLEGRSHGWRRSGYFCQFARGMFARASLKQFRNLLEWNIAGSQRGAGRLGGDFWDVLGSDAPSAGRQWARGMLTARFQGGEGKWGQLILRTSYTAPGSNGAAPTVRYEAFREGLQDCEARIAIEKALLDPARKARLGDDLAQRAQQVLDDRTRVLTGLTDWTTNFTNRQEALYATAAAVRGK